MKLEQRRTFDHYSIGYSPELEKYVMAVCITGSVVYENYYEITEKEFLSGEYDRLFAKFLKKGTGSSRYLSPDTINAIRNNKESPDVSVYDHLLYNDHLDSVPVEDEDILAAEERMGREFPYELRWFYQDVGCGYIKGNRSLINRIMSPAEAAAVCGDDKQASLFPDRSIPFVKVTDGAYVVLREDGKVSYFDKIIADTLFEFWEKEISGPDYFLPV